MAPRKPLGGAGGGGGGQILHEGALSSGPAARRDSEAAAQRLRDRERLSSLRLQRQVRYSDNDTFVWGERVGDDVSFAQPMLLPLLFVFSIGITGN